jgi:hypothetical protein
MKSSSRGGARLKWIVVHTAEGARTVASLKAFFNRPDAQGSSHAGVDDNVIEEAGPDGWVPYNRAAWTLRNGNEESENLEACGFASWPRAEWLKHRRMLTLIGQWIARRCKATGVPLVKLTAADVRAGRSGVIGHVDYTNGTGDGTHWDPGPGFPWDVVMNIARGNGDDDMPTAAELWGYNGTQTEDAWQVLRDAAADAERAKAIATQNQVEIRGVAKAVADLTALVQGLQ